jgi:hypothetical protein
MPEETLSSVSGLKRVRIVFPFNPIVEEHRTPTWSPANITPLAAMKNSSAAFLLTHLPTLLQDFIKPVLEICFKLRYLFLQEPQVW